MATITLTNEQLRLIQTALDLYSRIGILQFERILEHPTIDNLITSQFTPKKELKVGDNTVRGEIVEINKKYIKTKGSWGKGEEIKKWTDIDKIKLSPDWGKIHETNDNIKNILNNIKNIISKENLGHGSLGIHNKDVDNSCREAFDIIQVIRHEFWKENKNRSNITVDSSISFISNTKPVKVTIDTIKEIRNQKMKKLEKK